MAGTGFHPEGHDLKPYTGTLGPIPGRAAVVPPGRWICANCAEIDPVPGSDCIDDY